MSGGRFTRRVFLGAAVAVGLAPVAFALTSKASEAVAQAAADAEAAGKRLLVVFHASWCSWCELVDALMEDEACAPIFAKHFVIYRLRVLEKKPDMRAKQLEGADEVYSSLTLEKNGLPYMAALDGKAVRVSDSIMPTGDNFGFPVEAAELQNFQDMMRKAAPAMTADEMKTLRRACIRIYRQS